MFRYTNILIIFGLCLLFFTAVGQSNEQQEKNKEETQGKIDLKDKLFFDGTFTASLYTNYYVEISPLIGIKFNDKLSAGAGPIYCGFDYFKANVYGGRGIARFFAIEDFFLNAELQVLSLQKKYFDRINNFPENGRFLDENMLLGIGYRYPINNESYSYFIVMYNIDHDTNSFYESPVVTSIGFRF